MNVFFIGQDINIDDIKIGDKICYYVNTYFVTSIDKEQSLIYLNTGIQAIISDDGKLYFYTDLL